MRQQIQKRARGGANEHVCSGVAGIGVDAQFANNVGPDALGNCREIFLEMQT